MNTRPQASATADSPGHVLHTFLHQNQRIMKIKKLKKVFGKFQKCSLSKDKIAKIKGGNDDPPANSTDTGTEDIMDL